MKDTWKRQLLDSGERLIHIECDDQGSRRLRESLRQEVSLGIVQRQEAFYEEMKTAEYLRFFARLFRSVC